MKKIEIRTGYLPDKAPVYKGEYIYKVKYTREGAKGLPVVNSIHIVGDPAEMEFPKPVFSDKVLEGMGGINGRMEIAQPVDADHPVNGRIHQYYCIDNDVWIKNLGNYKYITEWTTEEKWGLVQEVTYDEKNNVIESRDL